MKVKPLVEQALQAVKEGEIDIYPSTFEHHYRQWLENLNDWNISRQIVWGIRIPAWKNSKTGEWKLTDGEVPKGNDWVRDEDTFDTWFSSSQWPFATLMSLCDCKGSDGFFDKFYPTSVMETGYDILRAWVSRMIMMGYYRTGQKPFSDVVLHGLVNDPYGKKMSKSKGNVVNPLELVEQYGADAVRFALVYGTALGHDQSLSYPKLEAMRKFTNKLWNMGRFIEMKRISNSLPPETGPILNFEKLRKAAQYKNDKEMVKKIEELSENVTVLLDRYDFNHASQALYEFAWHEFADKYIEDVKNRIDENSFLILSSAFLTLLKLLHPFMPYVTEEIVDELKLTDKMLIISAWPQ